MENLTVFKETDADTIYSVNGDIQGLVSVPKDLKNNIKVFMLFEDGISQVENKNDEMISELLEVSKRVNVGENDGLSIVVFIDSNTLSSQNAFAYTIQLNKIKELVNKIYNQVRKDRRIPIENFIKKVELLCNDDKYKNFVDFLCLQNPSKFHISSYEDLLNMNMVETNSYNVSNEQAVLYNPVVNNNISQLTNKNVASPQQINPSPIVEKLAINSVKPTYQTSQYFGSESSSGGGPSFTDGAFLNQKVDSLAKHKTLVKKLPNNHNAAFVKWPTLLFILLMSLVIGISFAIYLLK